MDEILKMLKEISEELERTLRISRNEMTEEDIQIMVARGQIKQ